MILEVYHGTDAKNAESILSGNFIYKRNKTHWLGNGIYFYLDLSLAHWWTKNPTKKFGIKIEKGVIIKAEISIDRPSLIDLRTISDYNFFLHTYYKEYLPILNTGAFNISSQEYKQLRCSYCDFLRKRYLYKAIIGNFSFATHSYLPRQYKDFSKKMRLPYIETQLCLFDIDCITNKSKII